MLIRATRAMTAAIDRKAIQDLRDEGENLLSDLVDMFIAEVPGQLATLEAALAKGDADAIRLTAHTLKGTAGNFGAFADAGAGKRDRGKGPQRLARRRVRDLRRVTRRVRAGSRRAQSRALSGAA